MALLQSRPSASCADAGRAAEMTQLEQEVFCPQLKSEIKSLRGRERERKLSGVGE